MTAADISQEALDLARENAKNQNLQIFLKNLTVLQKFLKNMI